MTDQEKQRLQEIERNLRHNACDGMCHFGTRLTDEGTFLLQQLRASLERERTYHKVLMRSGFNAQSLEEYVQRLNEWNQKRGES